MAKYADINSVINQMRSNTQSVYIKDVESAPHIISGRIELQRLLGLLNTTNDIKLQEKLFSALSVYLMFENEGYDIIIKCNTVYEKIHSVLTKGIPRKVTVALNFLSVLLYVDAVDDVTKFRKTLGMYARSRCRTSGCLAAMIDMFSNCMMHHDTWKALCQCIAIACNESEINQSYCAHLIPVCVKKCSGANMDILLVLHSLVLNHKRNTQLFFEYNGTAVFNRELLHNDKCLQLVTTVVQSIEGSANLRKTGVAEHLREFIRLYGPGSQIGQKAMIILDHIDSQNKGLDYHNSRDMKNKIKSQENDCGNEMSANIVGNQLDDTRILIQNVMQEVYAYKQNELGHLKEKSRIGPFIRGASTARNVTSTHINQIRQRNLTKKLQRSRRTVLRKNINRDLSFSFLNNIYDNHRPSRVSRDNRNETKIFHNISTNIKTNNKTKAYTNMSKESSDFYEIMPYEDPTTADLKSFRPIFSSTPNNIDNEDKTNFSKITTLETNVTIQSQVTLQPRKFILEKRKPKNVPKNNVNRSTLKNQSLSSKFFSAINESCTTLVKTVANIFKKKDPKSSPEDIKQTYSSLVKEDKSCSYSFLKYMQKRDAVLKDRFIKNSINYSEFSLRTRSCDTCDNTAVLKQKLNKNDHLKQTVEQLKLGINLFGCDFKKISRKMWPRDPYMTPVVLNNLYRKLILK